MKKAQLLVATSNPGKFSEIVVAFGGLPLELKSLNDFGVASDVEEDGSSYEENALLKARHFSQRTGLPTVADDSGIVVEALGNVLGVRTRRWGAGEKASDDEWIEYFLNEMRNVPDEGRGASFVSVVAVVWGRVEMTFRGETEGVITQNLEAPIKPGIPLSSCFKHKGADRVYAALSEEEKNLFSHRGKALMLAKDFLEKNLVTLLG